MSVFRIQITVLGIAVAISEVMLIYGIWKLSNGPPSSTWCKERGYNETYIDSYDNGYCVRKDQSGKNEVMRLFDGGEHRDK